MSRQKRKKWSESEARQVLARIERERISVAEMARRLGVTPQRIYWWRQRLSEEAVEAQSGSGFVEVTVPRTVAENPSGFVLHARNGRIIELQPGFDGEELARLLSVVEAVPC